jgi:hypothetical protein
MYTILKRFLAAAIVVALAFGITGCGIKIKYAVQVTAPPSESSPDATPSVSPALASQAPAVSPPLDETPTPSPSPSPSPSVPLVPYDGTVEHIFFHPVVAYPELAFDGDGKEKGIDQNIVTVRSTIKCFRAFMTTATFLST